MFKKISRFIIPVFMIGAGLNHFLYPAGYYKIIPAYLPYPVLLNIIAGAAEILLGTLFIFKQTRQLAVIGIVAMLIAFIPAHIVMIQKGFCFRNGFCLPGWALWARLFPLQFLLMLWVWKVRK